MLTWDLKSQSCANAAPILINHLRSRSQSPWIGLTCCRTWVVVHQVHLHKRILIPCIVQFKSQLSVVHPFITQIEVMIDSILRSGSSTCQQCNRSRIRSKLIAGSEFSVP